MHIGFIQLPVPEHYPFYARANRPLAAASMIAYAHKYCQITTMKASILPDDRMTHGGDAAILAWIANNRLDVLCFTLYLWNRERSLFIAQSIKQIQPEIVIVMGGPEVTEDQSLIDFPGADLLCVGEGEEFFARLLCDPLLRKRGVHQAGEIADLSSIPNPYLVGVLPVKSGDAIHFEQMRGCPHRCTYCYYGKGHSRVRRFPSDRVAGIFRLASSCDRTEVYFMDPTFNCREGLTDHLDLVARSNPQKIPIHTEIRLDLIDRFVADGMAAAGIRSVEAGLQSVNPKALAAVGRGWNRTAFQQGARLLMERGIEIRTGIILGLPEDSLDDFLETLDFLEDNGLASTAECFLLAVLPGTVLRRQLKQWQIEAMTQPPYWVLSTSRMKPEDFSAGMQIFERRSGVEYFPPIPPFGSPGLTRFQTVIDLRDMDLNQDPADILNPAMWANSMAVWIDDEAFDHTRLKQWADYLMSAAPYTCWRIVHAGNKIRSRQEWLQLRALFLNADHYVNRSRYLCRDPQSVFSVRLFQIVNDAQAALRFLEIAQEAELIIQPRPGSLAGWEEICRTAPWMIMEPHMTDEERRMLASWYADCPERILRNSS